MLTIDINNPDEFTFNNVRKLIASGDNSRESQLKITENGILSIAYGNEIRVTRKNLFTSIIFLKWNNCIGTEAAENIKGLKRTYSELEKIRDGR